MYIFEFSFNSDNDRYLINDLFYYNVIKYTFSPQHRDDPCSTVDCNNKMTIYPKEYIHVRIITVLY